MVDGRVQDAVGHRGLTGVDGVVEVVGRLGARVVVERHPVLAAQRLGGDEAAVTGRVVRAEPAVGGAVAGEVDAGPAGVVHGDPERLTGIDRPPRCDHQLGGRAGFAVLRVDVVGGQLG